MRAKTIIVILIICCMLPPIFGESKAVLTNIQGKVEVKQVGGAWAVAKDGMKIGLMDTISTGFNSSAELQLEDNVVQVSPLTRLTLDKLIEQSGKLSTNLYLKVGKVTADVKSSKGLTQDFKVQSRYSTASVRGTKLVYDGVSLSVIEGTVKLILGAPKRDFSQYLNQVAQSQGGEASVDLDSMSTEEKMKIVGDVVAELVQSGEIDQDTAADLVSNAEAVITGEHGTDGTGESVDVTKGNSLKLNQNPGATGGSGTGGSTGGGSTPRSNPKGGITIEWGVKK